MLNCQVFWESILPVVSAHAHNTKFSAKPSYLLEFMLELLCDSRNVHKLQTVGRFSKVRKLKIVSFVTEQLHLFAGSDSKLIFL